MRVIRVHEFGGADVLEVGEAERPEPGEGQVLVAVEVAAVLFADTLLRRGAVPSWAMPYVPGFEIGGEVVEAEDQALVGKRVVARTTGFQGGYGEFALADHVHLVPDGLPIEQAVAVFGGGDMATGLLDVMRVGEGDTLLVTAAAGRIGLMLVQLARVRGARVIGVTSPDKLAAVKEFGADAVTYDDEDWGRPTVVLDSVGGEIGKRAVAVAQDRAGLYGYASGGWPELDTPLIAQRGLTVVGASGVLQRRTPQQQRADAEQALHSGLTAKIHAVYPLERAAEAHTDLERRRNTGAVLLRLR
ncbi:alcohol dehydrogenase catalytic domain-containing protein [Kibdelosporangium phytohabitans]|uniref:Enoyl reductase (ER) domain-containing protein n=1 Tax=Kibdelosporangium phytohabitans TaxID=860235 RepID=A0A0N9IH80_9PSEU|nr:zinc-binding dehydrogenase [Kibdelosporangium phytohabitans]ALG14260.1 hypothetical protein AOZ06_51915 [Kibdelosporangium phytohabitans]MBE1466735.1 NADPH2:quinone reductase [Kibdelosporangium phytohabitans]